MSVRLTVLQANVARKGPAMDAALQIAATDSIDVVVLQEPWFDWEKKLTKTHPFYDMWRSDTVIVPRVTIYTRKGLRAHIPRTHAIRDILELEIPEAMVKIINIYRPTGTNQADDTHRRITELTCQGRTIALGDFN